MRKRMARNLGSTDPTTVHVLYLQGPADETDPRNTLREHLKSIRSVRRYEYDAPSGKLLVLGHISIIRLAGLLEEAGFQVSDTPFPPVAEKAKPAAADEAVPAADEVVPAADEAVPAADEAVPAADEAVPAADEAVPAADEIVPAADEIVPAADEIVPAADEIVPAADENVPAADENVPAADEVAPVAEEVVAAVEAAAALETSTEHVPVQSDWRTRLFFMASISFLGGLAIGFSSEYWTVAFPLLVLAMVLAGIYPAAGAFAALKTGRLDMNVLMCVVGLGAAFLGEWQEGAFVLVLFALSDVLQSRGMQRPRRFLQRSLEIIPDEATRLLDFNESVASDSDLTSLKEERVSIDSVAIGDYIKVLPGQRIPLDGMVALGQSLVSEVDITGQDIPIVKGVGAKVYAGSLNDQSELVIKVECLAGESTLDRINQQAGQAGAVDVPMQRQIARLTSLYTPAIIYLAFGVALIPPLFFGQTFHPWLNRGLMLLVLALPSALLVSVPIAITSALVRSARGGILIRSSHVLDRLGKLTTIAFEKRGILTRHEMTLTDVIAFGDVPETEALQVAASISAMRNQTIDMDTDDEVERNMAQGLVEAAIASEIPLLPIEKFAAEPGLGFEGTVKHPAGKWHFRVGSPEWMIDDAYAIDDQMSEAIQLLRNSGKGVLLVADKIGIFAAIGLEEPLREESRRLVERLKRLGIRRTALLTSDTELSARHVAWQIGIEEIHAEQESADKVKLIREWQQAGEKVAVVFKAEQGDADLDVADVGIVIGETDVAFDATPSDVVMLADDVARIPTLLGLAQRVRSKIRQNLLLALAAKLAVGLLVLFGNLHLWMAISAEFVATMLVMANGFMLLRTRV